MRYGPFFKLFHNSTLKLQKPTVIWDCRDILSEDKFYLKGQCCWLRGHRIFELCDRISSRKRKSYRNVFVCSDGGLFKSVKPKNCPNSRDTVPLDQITIFLSFSRTWSSEKTLEERWRKPLRFISSRNVRTWALRWNK